MGKYRVSKWKVRWKCQSANLGDDLGCPAFQHIDYDCFWHHIVLNTTVEVWIVGIVSGLFWSLGQNQQFHSMKAIGISNTVPLSTGLQLVFNALAGVVLFREWTTSHQISLGTLALFILIVGATLTSLRDNKAAKENKADNWSLGIKALALSTLGYVGYAVVVKWTGVDTKSMVLPQALGMVLGASFFAFGKDALRKETYKNVITGLVWGTGNFFMFLAIPLVGLAISYSFSQMGIIISTFGSILLLGEKKTTKELGFITFGSILIIIGGILLSNI